MVGKEVFQSKPKRLQNKPMLIYPIDKEMTYFRQLEKLCPGIEEDSHNVFKTRNRGRRPEFWKINRWVEMEMKRIQIKHEKFRGDSLENLDERVDDFFRRDLDWVLSKNTFL